MRKALTFAVAAFALVLVAFTPVKPAEAGVSVRIGVGPGGYYGWGYRPRYYGYPYAYYPYWRRPYYNYWRPAPRAYYAPRYYSKKHYKKWKRRWD
jgi:hypothetical protein